MDPHTRADREIEMIENDPNLSSRDKAERIREVERELKSAIAEERQQWEEDRYGYR